MTCAPRVPSLTVVSGRHEAATVAIEQVGRTAVGADPLNAVVVSDLAAGVGFALDWDGQCVTLAAVGVDLAIDGRVHRPGRSQRLRGSADLASGGISFRLALPPGAGAPSRAGPRGRIAGFSAGVACTAVLAATAALVAAPSRPGPIRAVSAPVADVRADITADVTALPAAPAAARTLRKGDLSAAQLLQPFRGQLAGAGLDGVSVEVQADGALAASGRIVPTKGEAWHAAVRWFDTAARGRAVLVDRVEVSAAASTLQVQAVYTGRNAYVIDGEGEKRFVGSSLPDGSVIQKIEAQRILVRRGEQTVAVRF